MNNDEIKIILETALLCTQAPLTFSSMKHLFTEENVLKDLISNDRLRLILEALASEWQKRGVELVEVASGWRFQSRPAMCKYLDRLRQEKPAAFSRAALETLTFIAYNQPVTRHDMDEFRGVTVSAQILHLLENQGWIDGAGHYPAPGKPALWVSTKKFLDDHGLSSFDQLPSLLR